ncbi:putative membrane protein [Sphingomonas laterariae]|uniref:Putative membrane protein n=1 Tax=Edaphosphingomonas laterariae TaxID=861865 RepID=A0A239C7L1_9SPHN|nr:DUF202 domain-containing protein [Sphingomonas laterariae]SNS15373.1 putative membrane protein [Sphingomonas laterariae]
MASEQASDTGGNHILPSDLGTMRTIMAADRTLMAWVRTALSMQSFGFTIYKFLEGVAASQSAAHSDGPQRAGLFLTAMGMAALVLGTISYWTTLRDLRRTEEFRLGRPALMMAAIMAAAGIALFIAIANRLV